MTASIYLLAGVVGVAVFTYPFFINDSTMVGGEALQLRSNLAPLLTMLLLLISLTVLFLEAQGQAVNAKIIASLGVLVAATSTLRFLEVAIPGPGGFSPMFVPILLSGYVFGARFGFLMGTMTMLVSALLTGGIGPWLPYQMFAAGWIGLTAGWLPHFSNLRREVALLVLFGFLWGVLYGVILNLYFWPFVSGDDVSGWTQGIGAADALERYIAFYLTTSFVWDLARAFGNGLLIAILAIPIIRVFGRFRDKFQFEVLGA